MNPFAPIRTGPEAEWSAKDHQNAANYYAFEAQDPDPGAATYRHAMRSAHNRHAAKAAALRGTPERFTRLGAPPLTIGPAVPCGPDGLTD